MVYQLVLRAQDVQIILNLCRTDSYRVIQEIKEEYVFSKKLKGSKIRTVDLAEAYDLSFEDIQQVLNQNKFCSDL